MNGQPEKKKQDWAVPFLTRLTVIGWTCVILYETVDRVRLIRQLCLLFGPWACMITLVNSLGLLLLRRRGVFLMFLLVILPPTIDFAYVIRNLAIQRMAEKAESAGAPARTLEKTER